ncbi:glycosyl hydrolase family 18 protein [Calidifontibacillus erzurumensis]|uniref:S-layer homology domain-containing protein n=1 Tax=Calidifontibacillus erzurumensis TaxID=2741433 RepID=A0A8J8GHR6_9BACI|nr:glycosyl hydrolase family 18 protein [Calidifontibacillus erzurumensis]NSL52018.1 S-layer homology domain-containing protein [Calidifontibacillus erzurumensis]
MKKFTIFLSVIVLFALLPLTSGATPSKKFNMTYLFMSSATDPIKHVDMTNGALDQVSPKYFQVLDDGQLKVDVPSNAKTVIAELHKRGIKVVPFLANNWAKGEKVFADSEQIASQIVKTMNELNVDGINIDIEGLGPSHRDSFTNFIKTLDSKLPAGKTLSIAVAPNPWGTDKGWQGFYDYKALAQYADYLFVMTYDERGGGSKNHGPVASLSFIEKSINYALKNVAPEKIVLGIPFYGRVWNMEDVNDTLNQNANPVLGESISLNKIPSLLNTYDVTVVYDKSTESVKGTFTIKQGDPQFQLKSWQPPLKPGTYEVWFENETSLKAKLDLVRKYNLKGVGSWSLGQEDPAIWKEFRLWLDGLDFVDVGATHWAMESIAFVKEKGWMLGKGSLKTFKPNDSLTRAETAAILTRVLNIQLKEETASPFTDIGRTYQWASTNIEIVRQHGVMNGLSATTFGPGKALSREEMAAILDRIIGGQLSDDVEEPAPVSFKDQNTIASWAYPAVVRMSSYKVFSGYEDGTFKPKKEISRAEMAALLSRIANYFQK